jgi:tetratricopeptide (TPR) repeat protein
MTFLLLLLLVLFQQADPDLDRALTELKAGNTTNAIAALTDSIKKHPDHAETYLFRGNLRMTTGDTVGALSDFNNTIRLKPRMAAPYHARAIVRLMAQDMAGATQDLDAALANGLKTDEIYSLRAELRRQQGDLKGALADLDESIKLNPNSPKAYATRGALLLELEEKDRALVDLNYLLTWYETEPAKRRENKPTEASSNPDAKNGDSDRLVVAVDPNPVNPAPGDKDMMPVVASAYLSRGLINSSRDNSDAAISDFTKSIRLDAKNVWAYYNRANELERKADLEAALADVSRAIQLQPFNGNLRVEHGVILTIMGNAEEAQVDFDMLLKGDAKVWQKRIDDRLEEVRKKVPH